MIFIQERKIELDPASEKALEHLGSRYPEHVYKARKVLECLKSLDQYFENLQKQQSSEKEKTD